MFSPSLGSAGLDFWIYHAENEGEKAKVPPPVAPPGEFKTFEEEEENMDEDENLGLDHQFISFSN